MFAFISIFFKCYSSKTNLKRTLFTFVMSVEKTYDEYLKEYIMSMDNTFLLFKINKCCQYSQLLPVYRKGTLADLHHSVYHHFGFSVSDIYVLKGENEKVMILNDDTVLIRDFLKEHSSSFNPVFPVPARVVYNIYFGEGGCCAKKQDEEEIIRDSDEIMGSGSGGGGRAKSNE